MSRSRIAGLALALLLAPFLGACLGTSEPTSRSAVPSTVDPTHATLPILHTSGGEDSSFHTQTGTPIAVTDSSASPGCRPDSSADLHAACGLMAKPDQNCESEGARYHIMVPAGAVDSATALTCSCWSTGWLEFEMSPNGQRFARPVQLDIDLTGTNADPSSVNYDGSVPRFFLFDETAGVWTLQPSIYDTKLHVLHVSLAHFSRYAVGGKAGW